MTVRRYLPSLLLRRLRRSGCGWWEHSFGGFFLIGILGSLCALLHASRVGDVFVGDVTFSEGALDFGLVGGISSSKPSCNIMKGTPQY